MKFINNPLLSDYSIRYKKQIIVSQIVWFVKNIPVWLMPLIAGYIINEISINGMNSNKKIFYTVLLTLVAVLLNILFQYIQVRIQSKVLRKIEKSMKERVLDSLLYNDTITLKKLDNGEFTNLISIDIDNAFIYFKTVYTVIMPVILNIIIAYAIVFLRSKIVFFFYIISFPISVLLTFYTQRKMNELLMEGTLQKENIVKKFCFLFRQHSYVKNHSFESEEKDKFDIDMKKYFRYNHQADTISSVYASIGWITFQVLSLICIYISSILAVRKKISIGEIATYQVLFSLLMNQIVILLNSLPDLVKGDYSLNKLSLFYEQYEYDFEKKLNKISIDHVESIVFNNVNFAYNENEILSNIMFEVKQGELIYIIGESGSGKSTFLKLILGTIKATHGIIKVNGIDINDISLSDYRKKISFLDQQNIMFDGTLKDNFLRYNKNISNQMIIDYLELFDLAELVPKLNYEINASNMTLSGGQIQRICIIRELLRDTDIFIFDEPTSSLDNTMKIKIIETIKKLKYNSIIVIVTHDINIIDENERVVEINKNGITNETYTF